MPTDPSRYTHGHHESVLRSHTWRTVENSCVYLLDALRPGVDVLDIGCGPGTITLDLAARVAPGAVVGVDPAPDAIDEAIARLDATDLPSGADVRFEVGDVHALRVAEDSFDVVHAHQVLQHLEDPVAALAEMRRVCRPGGVVAARDSDYAAMTWHPAVPGMEVWNDVYHRVTRANRAEADAGRHLLSWARAAGFDHVECTASAWCFATPEEREWWGGLWADRVEHSAFAQQAVDYGVATTGELAGIALAWRQWAAADDAWFAVLHGEIRCRA